MPSLEILQSGLLSSVQDRGRRGLAYYGIPRSGAMDARSARRALRLLGLPADAPLLECTALAPQLRFRDPVRLALSGADFGWQLDGQPVARDTVLQIRPGDVLSGGPAREGLRGYIALQGFLDAGRVYGSCATYPPAGLGRLLQAGDVLYWQAADGPEAGAAQPAEPLVPLSIPLRPGPECDWLRPVARELLVQHPYRLRPDSNRMGARLEGPRLEARTYQLALSVPVLPGFVQLPPGGQPIVILQDGQTTGGYPRIAYIREAELSAFNQIPLGGRVRFRWE